MSACVASNRVSSTGLGSLSFHASSLTRLIWLSSRTLDLLRLWAVSLLVGLCVLRALRGLADSALQQAICGDLTQALRRCAPCLCHLADCRFGRLLSPTAQISVLTNDGKHYVVSCWVGLTWLSASPSCTSSFAACTHAPMGCSARACFKHGLIDRARHVLCRAFCAATTRQQTSCCKTATSECTQPRCAEAAQELHPACPAVGAPLNLRGLPFG